ncbi:MAG: J domain-containing protein, partial [Anaerolineae bacterium]|nr:J domain-containing protein [Anaerolineae bacterium]
MTVDAYPLHWPHWFPRTDPAHRQRARFNRDGRPLTIADARGRVLREIGAFTRPGHTYRIDPDQVVISTDVPVRQDGLPYSGRKPPEDSGVAVYFELDGEPHVLPCDTWDRVADNMAAIAAHLGAMRGMERWGVGDLRSHFAGFTALEHNPDPDGDWPYILGVSPTAP